MNIGNLGILKKLFIILRCHKDIRRHRFVEFEYSGDKVADVEKQIEFFRSFLELIDTGSNVGKITRVVNELLDSET